MNIQRHFLSAAWPDMSAEEFRALRDSIGYSGLREPIVVYEGEILDGWQRYQGCLAEGVEPRFDEFAGSTEDAIDFVRDKHARRSLTMTQRLTSLATMMTLRGRGRPNKSAIVADLISEAPNAVPARDTVAKLAAMGGSSVRTAASVAAALAHGVPEVVESMKQGALVANKAEQIAKLPAQEQVAALHAKPVKAQGKPKKVPAAKWLNAEIKAAEAVKGTTAAQELVSQVQDELGVVKEQLAEAREDLDALAKVTDSDDQLAAALLQAKEARDLARSYKARIDSMISQIAELKRSAAYWEKKAKQVAA